MNRVYKTKWSAAHQQYVVTDEHHATKGKAAKSAVALAVAGLMMAAGASAAYVEPGFKATSSRNYDAAVQSWETAEYKAPWGLTAMKASKAYALGYHGQGVKLGIMDSGALTSHPDFAEGRLGVTEVTGTYGQSGNRYPQNAPVDKDTGAYKEGASFTVTGEFTLGMNDSHGTKVAGTMGSDRNGIGSHGVAWGSQLVSGNTGGTDSTNYGPFLDYEFFKKGYDALVAKDVKIINNSFGTNVKQYTKDENGKVTMEPYSVSGVELTTVQDVEYEYFLFKAAYNGKKSFVDAAWEAVENHDVIQVFTNGNNNRANPYHRALYPYFNPKAESKWIAIAGAEQTKADPNKYQVKDSYNEAGFAKYWTLAGPGTNGYTTAVNTKTGKPEVKAGYENGFASFSGTSMAAPFISGAFGVLASRYTEMDATQVREVLLTTASHRNPDGSVIDGWENVGADKDPSKAIKEGQVSDRMGWGIPDLEKGMYGPAQLLGKFEYKMNTEGSFDHWSNDISQVALEQRRDEEIAWLKSVTDNGEINGKVLADKGGDYKLENDKFIAGLENVQDIDAEKAKVWRQEYFDKRAEAIRTKIDGDLYNGHIIKDGVGTLVMTGNNTYKGDTIVKNGTLLAFTESIGDKNAVEVQGGTFGVLSSYDDQFTMKGHLDSKATEKDLLTITVGDQGTLYVDAASNVTVKKVEFGANKNVKVGLAGADASTLVSVYNGEKDAVSGTFEIKEGTLTGVTHDVLKTDSLFFDLAKEDVKVEDKKISVSMTKKEGVTMESFADTENQKKIASAIAASGNALTGDVLTAANEKQVKEILSTLDDDFYATARNALVMNATAVSRTVMDQARGMGEGRSAEVDNGRARIWATGIGHWGEAEGNLDTMDVDFRAGFLGAEALVLDNTKFGAFFGYGTTDYKSGLNKIDGDDKHFGVYGLTDIGNVTMTYGVAYTDQDRDTTRFLGGVANQHSENASVLQGFVEGAYNFDLSVAKVSPYVGFTWARVETDAVTDDAIGHSFKTDEIKDDIQIATLGVRTSVPFAMGNMPVALKADLGWSHYFGDTEGLVNVQTGANGQFAAIEGSELKDQANLGLGIVGQVAKHATVGVSYSGSWGSDISTHGIFANVRFNF